MCGWSVICGVISSHCVGLVWSRDEGQLRINVEREAKQQELSCGRRAEGLEHEGEGRQTLKMVVSRVWPLGAHDLNLELAYVDTACRGTVGI